MEKYFPLVGDLVSDVVVAILTSYQHNWLPLLFAILTAALMKVYVDSEKLTGLLLKRTKVSIVACVAFGALTPLCACGTMAVLLGLLSTAFPWSPMMAFLTSSPLMSPDGFVMNAGIIGFQFAVVLTISSIVIGLGSGFFTHFIETKTDFLKNQSRFIDKGPKSACGCSTAPAVEKSCCDTKDVSKEYACDCSIPEKAVNQGCGCGTPTLQEEQHCGCGTTKIEEEDCGCGTSTLQVNQECGCGTSAVEVNQGCGCGSPTLHEDQGCACSTESSSQSCCSTTKPKNAKNKGIIGKLRLDEVLNAVVDIGLKQILLYFTIFIALGYVVNEFVPTSFIINLFGANKFYGVPLAALIGIPIYISTESSVAIVNSFLVSGASGGAVLAFMITGPGTSAMVIAGLATFMKKRALILYVSLIFIGGLICGYLYDLLIGLGLIGL